MLARFLKVPGFNPVSRNRHPVSISKGSEEEFARFWFKGTEGRRRRDAILYSWSFVILYNNNKCYPNSIFVCPFRAFWTLSIQDSAGSDRESLTLASAPFPLWIASLGCVCPTPPARKWRLQEKFWVASAKVKIKTWRRHSDLDPRAPPHIPTIHSRNFASILHQIRTWHPHRPHLQLCENNLHDLLRSRYAASSLRFPTSARVSIAFATKGRNNSLSGKRTVIAPPTIPLPHPPHPISVISYLEDWY